MPGVTTGKYDVAVTAAIVTKERLKNLDFTMPIADATAYYVKRNNDDSIKSDRRPERQDRRHSGRQRAAREPSPIAGVLDKTGGKIGKIVEYTSYPEAYQDLALKRTDYVVNTLINLNALVKDEARRIRGRAGGRAAIGAGLGGEEG